MGPSTVTRRIREFLQDSKRSFQAVRLGLRYWGGPLYRKILGLPQRRLTSGQRLRGFLESLGITYIKLGQYLATRFDILPADLGNELNKLFEGVPPLTLAEVAAIIEAELGQPLAEAYPYFESDPIAAASVAQVHRARISTGAKVAVKIQRPGLEPIFRSDMRNLQRLGAVADFFHLLGLISIQELVLEFDRWTSRELDFRLEGQTADTIRRNAVPNEIIPYVYWHLTTARVLTMEFMEGVSLAKIADLIDAGKTDELRRQLPRLSVPEVGRNIAIATLNQLFVTGVFHGDPHPGNVLIRDDNAVAFVDFGIFGELGPYERETLASHIENVALGNIEESYYYYSKLVFSSPDADLEGFARQAKGVLRQWYNASQNESAPVEDKHLGKYSAEMFDAVRKHRLRLAMDTMLFWRALNTLDATALRLSSVFDLLGELRGFFERIRPSAAERVVQALTDFEAASALGDVAHRAPAEIRALLEGIVRRGQWDTSTEESVHLMRQANRETSWLAGALIGVSLLALGYAGIQHSVWFAVAAVLLYASIIVSMYFR